MTIRARRALAAALLGAVMLAPTAMTGGAHAAPSSVSMDARSEATQLRSSAVALRSQVSTLLQKYMDAYADRFTAAEVARLKKLQADSDRQMAAVVGAVTRLRTAVSQGRSTSAIAAAKANATRAWTRAKSTAETSWEQARGIVEPKLSLFERLGALSDYNDTMARFDELGAEIRAFPTR